MRLAAVAAAVVLFAASPPQLYAEDVVPAPSRDVTPPGFTPGPKIEGPLVREPVPPKPPDPPRWRRFNLPKTLDAATFSVKGRTIAIAGVTPPPTDKVCPMPDGTTWPCGRGALTALRMFLHGRPVECFFPPVGNAETIIAPCRVGRTDLGLWLLGQGWASPGDLATDEYRKAYDEARCAGRGLWRGTTPEGCPG